MRAIFQSLATCQNHKTVTMKAVLSNDRMYEESRKGLLFLAVGGALVDYEGCLNLTPTSVQSSKELMTKVFLNINEHYEIHKWLSERSILAPNMDWY